MSVEGAGFLPQDPVGTRPFDSGTSFVSAIPSCLPIRAAHIIRPSRKEKVVKTLTGVIFNIVPLVVCGNTIHVFSLAKERDDRWSDPKVYKAVFITPQPSGDGQPSDLALQLACMRDETVVEVTIEDI